jgi:hypothetical protein
MDETYRRYLAELDDVLLNGSPKTLRKFMKRHGMKQRRGAEGDVPQGDYISQDAAAAISPTEQAVA